MAAAASYNACALNALPSMCMEGSAVARNGGDAASVIALQQIADALIAAHTPPLPPLTVRLSGRLTRSAGIYRPPGDVAISRHFLREHGPDAAALVLRHEVAHHAVRWTAGTGVRPHGPEFRAAAKKLGAPRRAPAFTVPGVVYGYRCAACGWTWVRRRRIRRGRRYACGRCAPAYDERFRLRYAGSWRIEAKAEASAME